MRRGQVLTVAVAVTGVLLASCTSGPASSAGSSPQPTTARAAATAVASATAAPTTTSPATHPRSARTVQPSAATHHTSPSVGPAPRSEAVARRAASLPLPFRTGDATQLITVTAPSTSSTHGSLQAWRKVAGGWRRVGAAVPAWVGSDGLTRHPSESLSATPIGSFTLTRAFGHDVDPGTALPYTRTTPADWWISQPGPLYNTMQRCAADCPFTRGDPNEHLYYETPYYNYAAVIDYNTRNAPGGVVQGAGSAFFLHVTVGAPTAGCVSIAQQSLVTVLRWLSPARHPRILIGIGRG